VLLVKRMVMNMLKATPVFIIHAVVEDRISYLEYKDHREYRFVNQELGSNKGSRLSQSVGEIEIIHFVFLCFQSRLLLSSLPPLSFISRMMSIFFARFFNHTTMTLFSNTALVLCFSYRLLRT
jgi:hypothetical protein